MHRRTLLLASLALASCTTTQDGIRKAAQLTVEGCRGYLVAFPDAKGTVGEICRKVVGAQRGAL